MSAGLMGAAVMAITQAGTLLSVVAFLFIATADSARQYRRAWLIQFLAQPFWLANTWIAGQWVMFAVSVFFTAIAIHGVLRFHLEIRELQERTLS